MNKLNSVKYISEKVFQSDKIVHETKFPENLLLAIS